MNKKDVQIAKSRILKCLTEEFDYGRRKDGKPLKRRKINEPLFFKNERIGNLEAHLRGEDPEFYTKWDPIYTEVDLDMLMDKVILGLYFALEDSSEKAE